MDIGQGKKNLNVWNDDDEIGSAFFSILMIKTRCFTREKKKYIFVSVLFINVQVGAPLLH